MVTKFLVPWLHHPGQMHLILHSIYWTESETNAQGGGGGGIRDQKQHWPWTITSIPTSGTTIVLNISSSTPSTVEFVMWEMDISHVLFLTPLLWVEL